jgi:hypothetical protein
VTWADGSSNDYGNWLVPTSGIANGNCSGACATIMYSAYNQNPGTWNVVAQNSGYFPAICQRTARGNQILKNQISHFSILSLGRIELGILRSN